MASVDPNIAWLAGLLEGEGCFTYEENGQRWRHARVTLGMTDADVVQRAAALMPGSRYVVSHPPSRQRLGNKPLHIARCNGRSALTLMRLVLPYMGERRAARITEIINLHEEDRTP